VATAQPTTPSCKAQATEKKLAGAAQKSFMTKCENDAKAVCNRSAADKKLSGAAKDGHIKKCVSDSVGS
jgi:psiF repeat